MKNPLKTLVSATVLATASFSAQSDILWSDISLTSLVGDGYSQPFGPNKGEDSSGQVYTLEHIGVYNFGKSFFFVDRFISGDKAVNSDETHMEFGVDLSLSWMTGLELKNDLIKDVYFTTHWESINPEGMESTDNLLAGGGVSWTIPGFVCFYTNLYYRMNENDQQNVQLTTVWSLPFTIAGAKFAFDGFFNLVSPTENIKTGYDIGTTFHTQPQIKLDVGDFFNESDKFFVGIEVDHWQNKFGAKDQDQTAPQLMVQVHF